MIRKLGTGLILCLLFSANAFAADTAEVSDAVKVSYLGPAGTYTEEAAQFWFQNGEELIPKETVNDAIADMLAGDADFAVIPQENTVGGAVVNYVDALIAADEAYVAGEVVLPISQTLMGIPGSKLSDIKIVCSHAQGLTQSAEWRAENLPDAQTEEMGSTAAAASYVAQQQDPSIAAVAAPGAASLYGLEVLAENVQITDANKTRFYVLSREALEEDGAARAVFVADCEGNRIDDIIISLHDCGLEPVSIHDRPEGSRLGRYYYVIEAENEEGITGEQIEAVSASEDVRFAGVFNVVEKVSAAAGEETSEGNTADAPAGEEASEGNTEVASAGQESVDYSLPENWAYFGVGENREADLFLVCPTVDTKDEFNMSLDDTKTMGNFLGALNMERGIYEESTRMYAPYYRQAAMKVYSLSDEEREPYMEFAYRDISAAFSWYLENENEGRPIILAGFSQGADMCLRLLAEYFGDEELYGQLAAVYAIGWPCTEELVREYPQIRPAESADDIGTVISFDCEAPEVTETFINPAGQKAYSINPLSWTTDSVPADKEENIGACFTDYSGEIQSETPGLCGCYIDEARGVLKVTDIKTEDYPAIIPGLPDGAWHIYDYQFFFRNLQENVETRLARFLEQNASGMTDAAEEQADTEFPEEQAAA